MPDLRQWVRTGIVRLETYVRMELSRTYVWSIRRSTGFPLRYRLDSFLFAVHLHADQVNVVTIYQSIKQQLTYWLQVRDWRNQAHHNGIDRYWSIRRILVVRVLDEFGLLRISHHSDRVPVVIRASSVPIQKPYQRRKPCSDNPIGMTKDRIHRRMRMKVYRQYNVYIYSYLANVAAEEVGHCLAVDSLRKISNVDRTANFFYLRRISISRKSRVRR